VLLKAPWLSAYMKDKVREEKFNICYVSTHPFFIKVHLKVNEKAYPGPRWASGSTHG
jgi:hypothetical protein